MDKIKSSEYELKSTIEYDVCFKAPKTVKQFRRRGKIDFNKLTYKDVRSCLHLMKEMKDWATLKICFVWPELSI
jgi:hypothetical protein